jgi:predicted transcriptional regulator
VTLSISINDETEARLQRMASAAGKDVPTYVAQLVEQAAATPALEELLAPLRKQFAESTTSDEQLVDEITGAQTDYRAQRQKKSA